jgi:3-deoxy-D-manno-octulosonic acid kinase
MRSAADFTPHPIGTAAAGDDFPAYRLNRRRLYLRRDLASHAAAIFLQLDKLETTPAAGAGNRRSGFVLELPGGPNLFARRARRGGLIRFISSGLFIGLNPRPLRELAVTTQARRRGVAVAEPIGAIVEWVAPALYRAVFLTRAMLGMTLWEFLRADDDEVVRAHVIEQARRAIDTMHQAGLFHADLNLHNLFITNSGEGFAAVILDLDKAVFMAAPLVAAMRRRNFERLARSARKLDPHGRILLPRALATLTGASLGEPARG